MLVNPFDVPCPNPEPGELTCPPHGTPTKDRPRETPDTVTASPDTPMTPLPTPPATAEQGKPSPNLPAQEGQPAGCSTPKDEPRLHTCGRRLRPDATFCDQCGARVGPVKEVLCLVVLSGDGNVTQTIPVDADEVTIGSHAGNAVVLAADRYASGRHARLARHGELYAIEDLGSTNGTYVRVRRPQVLQPGDELRMGTTVLRFDRQRY